LAISTTATTHRALMFVSFHFPTPTVHAIQNKNKRVTASPNSKHYPTLNVLPLFLLLSTRSTIARGVGPRYPTGTASW
jgi:hypothetical protein